MLRAHVKSALLCNKHAQCIARRSLGGRRTAGFRLGNRILHPIVFNPYDTSLAESQHVGTINRRHADAWSCHKGPKLYCFAAVWSEG
ncbi:hypothetical protein SAMN05216338_103627 [Bradyrhizobium sp. Rc2d]|nr:hypothetical protein SAMN05216338_103627 [Bradyrhizobium sp. Rc2d]